MSLFKDISSIAFDPLGAISSVATSLINAHSQKETNKSNAYQNQLSREFTEQQAQLDRDFNAQQSDLQNQFNAREAEKSRYFNADQAAKQMEFQKEMWNQENEYNDPSNQIARLKRAGVNPNWVDGLDNTAGSVSGGAAATSSPASGSSASHSSLGAPSSIPMQPVTVENPLLMASQIRLANAQADKAAGETDYVEAQKQRLLELLQGEKEMQRIQIDSADFDLHKMKPEQLSNLISQTESFTKACEKTDQEILQLRQYIDNLKSDRNLTDEQVKRARIENETLADLIYSEIYKNIQSACASQEQAKLYAQEASNAIIEGGLIAIEFQKSDKSKEDVISITKSDNEWSKLKNHWRAQYPRLMFMMEYGKEVMSGVGRGVGAVLSRIGEKALPR